MNKTKAKIIFQEKQQSGIVEEPFVKYAYGQNVVNVRQVYVEVEVFCYHLVDAEISVINLVQKGWIDGICSSRFYQEKVVLAEKINPPNAIRAAIAALDEKVKAFALEYPPDTRTKEQILADYLEEEEEESSD